jgi:hypothetical protein
MDKAIGTCSTLWLSSCARPVKVTQARFNKARLRPGKISMYLFERRESVKAKVDPELCVACGLLC